MSLPVRINIFSTYMYIYINGTMRGCIKDTARSIFSIIERPFYMVRSTLNSSSARIETVPFLMCIRQWALANLEVQ